MSNSLGPYELYPVRLLCPWGFSRQEYWSGFLYPSPGDLPKPGIEPKSPTLQVSSLPFEPPGKPKHTGVCSLSLLQGILPSQGSNLGPPLCRRILYQLSHKGSPRILKCVAYLFSSGSSQPRNWTRVSCTASRFFINWAMREAQSQKDKHCTVPLICSA